MCLFFCAVDLLFLLKIMFMPYNLEISKHEMSKVLSFGTLNSISNIYFECKTVEQHLGLYLEI